MDAYLTGLEQAAANGHDLSQIQSVASFFVSRVDSEVDKRLDAIGSDEATALKGKAAIANGRLAYAAYEEVFASERFAALQAKGANRQRPLWASTGVKDPDLPDTLYVTELVVANTVNTMPEKTMQAFADHGELNGDRVSGTEAEAPQTFAQLEAVGVDLDDVWDVLEKEGVDKFDASWAELVGTVQTALDDAKKGKTPGRVDRRRRPQQLTPDSWPRTAGRQLAQDHAGRPPRGPSGVPVSAPQSDPEERTTVPTPAEIIVHDGPDDVAEALAARLTSTLADLQAPRGTRRCA